MGERFESLSDGAKNAVKKYRESRADHMILMNKHSPEKTKGKNYEQKKPYLTAEQIKKIDREFQQKVDQIFQSEQADSKAAADAAKKLEQEAERQNQKEDTERVREADNKLKKIDLANIETEAGKVDLKSLTITSSGGGTEVLTPIKLDDTLLKQGIPGIQTEYERWMKFNQNLTGFTSAISGVYQELCNIVETFNYLREKDTFWTKSSGYENLVGPINDKINEMKNIFNTAKQKLDEAKKSSDQGGRDLDDAPDNLRAIEVEHNEKTRSEFDNQDVELKRQNIEYNQQRQNLENQNQALLAGQDVLMNQYQNVENQKNVLMSQQNEIQDRIGNIENIKRNYQQNLSSICQAYGIQKISDLELRMFISNYEGYLDGIPDGGKKDALVSILQNQEQRELLLQYLEAIDAELALSQQNCLIGNGISSLSLQETNITNQQNIVEGQIVQTNQGIVLLDGKIQSVQNSMIQSQQSREQAEQYYKSNYDSLDALDMQISLNIVDTTIENDKNFSQMDSCISGLKTFEVTKKGLLEATWDSTIGGIGKLGASGFRYLSGKLNEFSNRMSSGLSGFDFIGIDYAFQGLLQPVYLATGFLEGGCDAIQGIFSIFESPLKTVKGLGQLIGRDAISGERSWGTAGESWLNIGKDLINRDGFVHAFDNDYNSLGISLGEFEHAVGKVGFNAISTFFTGGAAGASKVGTVSKLTKAAKLSTGERALALTTAGTRIFLKDSLPGKTIGGAYSAMKGLYQTARHPLTSFEHSLGYARNFGDATLLKGGALTFVDNTRRFVRNEPRITNFKWLDVSKTKYTKKYATCRGELLNQYKEFEKYLDKYGNLKPDAKVPFYKRTDIVEFQQKFAKTQKIFHELTRTESLKGSLMNVNGEPTVVGTFVLNHPGFEKVLNALVKDPESAFSVFNDFVKKNKSVDFSSIEKIMFMKCGRNYYGVRRGKLIRIKDYRGIPYSKLPPKVQKVVDKLRAMKKGDNISYKGNNCKIVDLEKTKGDIVYKIKNQKTGEVSVVTESLIIDYVKKIVSGGDKVYTKTEDLGDITRVLSDASDPMFAGIIMNSLNGEQTPEVVPEEIQDLKNFLSNHPSNQEIRNFISSRKSTYRKHFLIENGDKYVLDFNLIGRYLGQNIELLKKSINIGNFFDNLTKIKIIKSDGNEVECIVNNHLAFSPSGGILYTATQGDQIKLVS